MSTSVLGIESALGAATAGKVTAHVRRTQLLCALLTAGSLLSAVFAARAGHPAIFEHADPALAALLRGMALIKAAMVVAALALLVWRFRSPIGARLAAGYIVSVWIATSATVMVWQLSFLPLAAAGFHLALLATLLLAWRDRGERLVRR